MLRASSWLVLRAAQAYGAVPSLVGRLAKFTALVARAVRFNIAVLLGPLPEQLGHVTVRLPPLAASSALSLARVPISVLSLLSLSAFISRKRTFLRPQAELRLEQRTPADAAW